MCERHCGVTSAGERGSPCIPIGVLVCQLLCSYIRCVGGRHMYGGLVCVGRGGGGGHPG
jgi:hypothetical protein